VKFLQPYEVTGKYDDEIVWNNPELAEGVLLKAYGLLPSDYLRTEEFGADDAVTNQLDNSIIEVATGAWSSRNNPFGFIWFYLYCYVTFKFVSRKS